MYVSSKQSAITGDTLSAAQTSTAASGSSNTALGDTQSMFLTLLTTELKTQDPTSPQDPMQMVNQLVQFNTLNEVISINQSLNTLVANSTPSAAISATSSTGAH